MKLSFDTETGLLVGGVIGVLLLASVTGWILARRTGNAEYRSTIANLNARTRAWWIMVAIFLLAMLSGGIGSVVLFGLMSFLALREFVTMTPTKRGDHGTLLWVFFVITPLQYVLVATSW
jgi:phosphatidate cytidylyltransferase